MALEADTLVFYLNGKRVEDNQVDPAHTLLYYLRRKLKKCGTKLGCGEGGCGACTVMISKYDRTSKKIAHYSVNACLTPACAVHGLSVTTVEGLGSIKTRLHPVQERIAKTFGSQCGFCTPGIVMSMYTLLRNKTVPSIDDIETYMQGNLCRCTGYRPIWEGFKTFTKDASGCCQRPGGCCQQNGNSCVMNTTNGYEESYGDKHDFAPYDPTQEPIFPPELMISDILDKKSVCFKSNEVIWHRPISIKELVDLKGNNPEAKIIVGNSEIGVETKFKNFKYKVLISPVLIKEMNDLEIVKHGVKFGGAVSLSTIHSTVDELIGKLKDYKTRSLKSISKMLYVFAGMQIRNTASLVGNIMTASPISDLNPLLLACGATLTAVSQDGKRDVKMDENFFLSYRKTCIKPNEIIVSVFIPFTKQDEYFYGFKQARRKDDDIAIVNAGMRVQFHPQSDKIKNISLTFGGLAPTSVFAMSTAKALQERKWNMEMFEEAVRHLEDDLPLSPDAPGGMVQFRRSLSTSFFFKFYLNVLNELKKQQILADDIPENYKSALKDVEAPPMSSSQIFKISDDSNDGSVGKPLVNLSAYKQATGEAVYIDDIPRYEDELYLAFVFSSKAHARIVDIDASKALEMTGVECFLSSKDLPESCNITGPVSFDEELFASRIVTAQGQAIGVIIAKDQLIAQKAAKLVQVTYEDLPIILTIEESIEKKSFFGTPVSICNGDIATEMSRCDHVIDGEMRLGAQEHFYLETQACLAVPHNEDGEVEILCSSQNPTLTQMLAAKVLGVQANKVVCRVKRLGGGFGGKETRFHFLTSACALAAEKLQRPVRCMLDRDEDMISTGTRHSFLGRYKVGFNSTGELKALDIKLYCNAGNSLDLSSAVVERGLFHCNNAYKIATISCEGFVCKTNTPSNTAFRGFGAPQGMMMGEDIIDRVAHKLDMPPEKVRQMNLYKENDRTHYSQILENCTLGRCWDECIKNCEFNTRKIEVDEFNSLNRWKKRGISTVATMFGISFTFSTLNQAGALIHIYKDGSVLISHSGVEMGQGLHTKMIQVASTVLNISHKLIHICEVSTDKVPNTSPTAASASSDLNGMAIKAGCETLVERMKVAREENPKGTWEDWVLATYNKRISLSTTGYYRTPELNYSFETNQGRPFNYYTFGAACSEVEIDCLTGDHKVIRTDIVMDLGNSLSPAIDIGQVEGGFIQGYGLFVLEEQKYSPSGFLYTRGPGMYKIPGFTDIPSKFNVSLLANAGNPKAVFSSKAVGEPPLFLASSVFFAIKEAVRSARSDSKVTQDFSFNSPATSENIRVSCSDRFTQQFPPAKPGTFKPWDVSI